MSRTLLEGLMFGVLLLSALAFLNLLVEYPVIVWASVGFVALTAAGYEITRRLDKP